MVLFALLLIVEYSFRYFNAFPQTGVQSYSYERFIALKEFIPSVEVSSYSDEFEAIELKEIEVKPPCLADSNGLLSTKQTLNQKRILLLGDVQTCNLDLNQNERIHQRLLKGLDSSYQVLNAAFPGSDLIHSTNKMVNVLLSLRPKMVIINHNLTDLLILAKNGSYWSKVIGDKKKARVWTTPFAPTHPLTQVEDSLLLKEYSNAMRNIGQLLSHWHIKPIFLTQALNHNDSASISELLHAQKINLTSHRLSKLHQKINQEIREICEQNNWSLIDLEKEIENNPTYFNNYLLFNSKGVQIVSQHIADSINTWK